MLIIYSKISGSNFKIFVEFIIEKNVEKVRDHVKYSIVFESRKHMIEIAQLSI